MNRISPQATIGKGTVCHSDDAMICPGAVIGKNCKIGNGAFICPDVVIGDGVFVAQCVTFINDNYPRAINPDGTLKESGDWQPLKTVVKYGATIGANSTVLGGVTIGEWALIGAGSVVTRDVPAYAKVFGNPGRVVGWVDEAGNPVTFPPSTYQMANELDAKMAQIVEDKT